MRSTVFVVLGLAILGMLGVFRLRGSEAGESIPFLLAVGIPVVAYLGTARAWTVDVAPEGMTLRPLVPLWFRFHSNQHVRWDAVEEVYAERRFVKARLRPHPTTGHRPWSPVLFSTYVDRQSGAVLESEDLIQLLEAWRLAHATATAGERVDSTNPPAST